MEHHEGMHSKMEQLRAKGVLGRQLDKAAHSTRLTLTDYAYAIERCYGVVGKAAKMLGIRRETLQRKIDMTPSLQHLVKTCRQERVDEAEFQLAQQVEEGVLAAITYTLSRLGKDRGYTEKSEVEHSVDLDNIRDAASLIEAMRRGANTAKLLEDTKTIEATDYTCLEKSESESLVLTS